MKSEGSGFGDEDAVVTVGDGFDDGAGGSGWDIDDDIFCGIDFLFELFDDGGGLHLSDVEGSLVKIKLFGGAMVDGADAAGVPGDGVFWADKGASVTGMTEFGEYQYFVGYYCEGVVGAELGAFAAVGTFFFVYFWVGE